jgi:hypothetical protein
MTTLLPPRFLVRVAHACRYAPKMPLAKGRVVDLPDRCRIDNFAALDGARNFADLRLAWNETGLGVQLMVDGKKAPPTGDAERPRSSDGLSLWIDTRDSRTGHRASRTCHQFHLLPAAANGEPWFGQAKITRALADAPLCKAGDVPFRVERFQGGYRLEAFLTAGVLAGYDPEQFPRLGFYYAVRDAELGEEFLSVNADFPYWDDPSLWSTLELER